MRKSAWLGLFALAVNPAFAAETKIESDQVIITASRFVESATSGSVGVEIISADEIAASGAPSIPQLLSRYAGIYSRDSSSTADRQIDLRGFGVTGDQNTVVVLDGQRLNENELVAVKWSSIPMESVERIEILRGSGAVLYGAGATGGVINIITNKPRANTSSAYVQAGYGSDANQQLRMGLSAAGENIGFSLHASHQETDGYRDNSERRQDNLEGSLKLLSLPVGVEFKFGVEGQHQGFPGARTPAELKNDRRGTSTPEDYGDREGWHANLLTQGVWRNIDWNLDLGHRNTQRTGLLKDYFFGIFNTYLDTKSDVSNFSPRIRISHQLFGGEDHLVLGFDYENWRYDSFRSSSSSDPAAADVRASQRSRAFYAQERIEITPLTQIQLGGRWQKVSYAVDDRVNPAAYAHQSKDETEHAYEFGLQHRIHPKVTLFGKVGHSFRLPTLDEIYSQYGGPFFDSTVAFLDPQTSNDAEIGLETSFGNSQLRASIYRMQLDNEIHCMTTVAPGFCSNINLPPTERRGLELAGTTPLGQSLELRANYTLTSSHFRSGSFLGTSVSGNEVPLVPRHRANLGLTWKIKQDTRLIANTQLVSRQRFDNDQTNSFSNKIAGYSITDIVLEHEHGPWRFAGTINNLFDRKYYTYGVRGAATFNAYPEQERTFLLSGEYRWQ